MARLIDANEALRMMRNSKADNPCTDTIRKDVWNVAHDCAISCVDACPTVELVHCQDCKHLYNRIGYYRCTHHRGLREISEDSYCGYGERRADG